MLTFVPPRGRPLRTLRALTYGWSYARYKARREDQPLYPDQVKDAAEHLMQDRSQGQASQVRAEKMHQYHLYLYIYSFCKLYLHIWVFIRCFIRIWLDSWFFVVFKSWRREKFRDVWERDKTLHKLQDPICVKILDRAYICANNFTHVRVCILCIYIQAWFPRMALLGCIYPNTDRVILENKVYEN